MSVYLCVSRLATGSFGLIQTWMGAGNRTWYPGIRSHDTQSLLKDLCNAVRGDTRGGVREVLVMSVTQSCIMDQYWMDRILRLKVLGSHCSCTGIRGLMITWFISQLWSGRL